MEDTTNVDYSISSIQIPSDVEAVRMRPGMYVGEMDNPRQLFSEALDNALDESQSGYSNLTEVFVDTHNRTYTVTDYGRGIPMGKIKLPSGIEDEVVRVLATKLHSGAKFNNNAYRIRSGLHGVGLGCCNALSESFQIITRREGKSVYFASEHGEDRALIYADTNLPNGCTISIKGDSELFDTNFIPIDFIEDRCKVAKAFGYPINLYIDNDPAELEIDSLADLISVDRSESIYYKMDIKAEIDTGEFIHVAIMYTSDTNSKYQGYTNLLNNKYGGTHTRLIERAIVDTWQKFYGECETELKPYDCTTGLRCLVAVFINDPEFSSQTKDKLTTPNKEIQPLIDAFAQKFYEELENDVLARKALLKRFAEYRISQNRLTSKKEIMDLIKVNEVVGLKGSTKRKTLVPGLAECTSNSIEGSEIFIVEGESAAGGAKRARNKRTQAVLPLRGKIKNISWMQVTEALKSEDIRKIINSNGAGVGEDCDPERCRYERVNILADADPDGKHITALNINSFIWLQAPLVKAGRVYVVVPPLYGYDWNGEKIYTNDFDSIPDEVKKDKSKFTRYKGLGEMDDEELYEACLDRKNRISYRVQYPQDLDRFTRILGTTSGRKELLEDLGLIKYIEEGILVEAD